MGFEAWWKRIKGFGFIEPDHVDGEPRLDYEPQYWRAVYEWHQQLRRSGMKIEEIQTKARWSDDNSPEGLYMPHFGIYIRGKDNYGYEQRDSLISPGVINERLLLGTESMTLQPHSYTFYVKGRPDRLSQADRNVFNLFLMTTSFYNELYELAKAHPAFTKHRQHVRLPQIRDEVSILSRGMCYNPLHYVPVEDIVSGRYPNEVITNRAGTRGAVSLFILQEDYPFEDTLWQSAMVETRRYLGAGIEITPKSIVDTHQPIQQIIDEHTRPFLGRLKQQYETLSRLDSFHGMLITRYFDPICFFKPQDIFTGYSSRTED